ncbi:MAG TPA: hypothetical protein VFQ06_07135, partial [Nitrospira sp.]|nr:hypothetical protein [Nitrospira sp.]
MKLHVCAYGAATFKLVAAALVLALCTVTAVPSAWSQETVPSSSDSTEGGNASSAGMGAAAGVSTLL